MTIDVQPEIEVAEGIDAIALEMRELPHFYLIRHADGSEATVKWEDKGLAEFCPKKTVSEFMAEMEAGYLNRIETYKHTIETKEHPTWKDHKDTGLCKYGKIVWEEIPYKLHDVSGFERLLRETEAKLGKLRFVKIVFGVIKK